MIVGFGVPGRQTSRCSHCPGAAFSAGASATSIGFAASAPAGVALSAERATSGAGSTFASRLRGSSRGAAPPLASSVPAGAPPVALRCSSSIAWHLGSTLSSRRLSASLTWRPVDCLSIGFRKPFALLDPPPVTRSAAASAKPAAAGMQPPSAIEQTPAPRMIRSRDMGPRCAKVPAK